MLHRVVGPNIARNQIDRFRHAFETDYGTLVCLYDIIDHNGRSSYSNISRRLNGLTREQAYRYVDQFIFANIQDRSEDLRAITEDVEGHLDRFTGELPRLAAQTQR